MSSCLSQSWDWPSPYDFGETTRLLGMGSRDPTVRREPNGLWRTARLSEGSATVQIVVHPEQTVAAKAWGAGASEALEQVPSWLGLLETPWRLPSHPTTDRLLRRHPGLRLCNIRDVYRALLGVVLQQKVTWHEAAYTWRRLVEHCGGPAPGPTDLLLPPAPQAILAAGVDGLVDLGIGRQRARTLVEVAFSASRLQRVTEMNTLDALSFLQNVRGIGPWTAATALGMRLGRPEPLVYGDYHLPNTVCWALANEERGTDARMEELLQAFAGQAFRVVRLLFAARIEAPRRGPRMQPLFGRRF